MNVNQVLRMVLTSALIIFCGTSDAACRSTLHYVNGVMNADTDEAIAVTKSLREQFKSDSTICVGEPLFNPSQAFLMDLAETYKLKLDNTQGILAQIKVGLIAGILQAWNNFIALFSGQQTDLYNYKETLTDMYTKLKPGLTAGDGKVLIAHSEGNLFALELQKLAVADGYPEGRVAVMHVASPIKVKLLLQRTMTVLSTGDTVIKANSVLFGSNKPNFEPDKLEQAELGHGFMAVYLNPDNMGTFTNYSCDKVRMTAVTVITDSIRRAAQCQFGPCVTISFGFSNGEC